MISNPPTVATGPEPNLPELPESPESDTRSFSNFQPTHQRVMKPDEIEQVNAFIDAFCFESP
jgi:hypothetical protein